MAVETKFPFLVPGNYIFDPNVIEVLSDLGGRGQLKLIRPANETFFVPYTSDINATFSDGSPTGTAFGGAAVSNGKLDLSFNDSRRVTYNANLNADSQQVGTIRIQYIPNYSGMPATAQILIQIKKTAVDNSNLIAIHHSTDGNISILLFDSTGTTVSVTAMGVFVAVLGVTYEFELNYDVTTGATRFFIDGVQFGAIITDVFTRSPEIGEISIGSTALTNFKVDSFTIFSVVQHTTDYVPGIENIISTLPIINIEKLIGFEKTSAITGFNNVTFTVIVDGVRKYWDGAAWVIASGSFKQTNTAQEIADNAAALVVNLTLAISSHLFSDNGLTTPQIQEIIVTFDFNPPPIDDVKTINVFGYIFDSDGNPDTNATVVVRPTVRSEYINANAVIVVDDITVATDVDGGWEVNLVQSADIGNTKYFFQMLTNDGNRAEFIRTVVGVTQVRFEDLPP